MPAQHVSSSEGCISLLAVALMELCWATRLCSTKMDLVLPAPEGSGFYLVFVEAFHIHFCWPHLFLLCFLNIGKATHRMILAVCYRVASIQRTAQS